MVISRTPRRHTLDTATMSLPEIAALATVGWVIKYLHNSTIFKIIPLTLPVQGLGLSSCIVFPINVGCDGKSNPDKDSCHDTKRFTAHYTRP